jgi:curli biogenesis system outer membrane secretion channel CsgG
LACRNFRFTDGVNAAIGFAMHTLKYCKGLFVVGTCLALLSARAEDKAQPTIFVAPLDGDVSQIMAWQPALGEGLAEMLITELSRLGKFQILESTSLKDLANEIKLGEAGYVSDAEKVDKGGWAGADFMFKGKVTRFGSKQQGVNLGGFVPGSLGKLGVKVTTSDVRIDWRLVDVYNRKVIKTGDAVASEKGTGFDVGVGVNGHGGNIGFANHEFMNSALGKATAKAVTNIAAQLVSVQLPESGRLKSKAQAQAKEQAFVQAAVDSAKATPGKVLAVVNKTTIIVSLGSKQGFKNGDKLKVYALEETKNDKGEVVFTEEKFAGEATLDNVQEEKSKATYSGTAEPQTGWTVKAN